MGGGEGRAAPASRKPAKARPAAGYRGEGQVRGRGVARRPIRLRRTHKQTQTNIHRQGEVNARFLSKALAAPVPCLTLSLRGATNRCRTRW